MVIEVQELKITQEITQQYVLSHKVWNHFPLARMLNFPFTHFIANSTQSVQRAGALLGLFFLRLSFQRSLVMQSNQNMTGP